MTTQTVQNTAVSEALKAFTAECNLADETLAIGERRCAAVLAEERRVHAESMERARAAYQSVLDEHAPEGVTMTVGARRPPDGR